LEIGDYALLCAAGLLAGILNTLAGGGSLLSVPLLVFLGLPGDVANGTNRVGILVQSVIAAGHFRSLGVSGVRDALPVLAPVALGSLIGAWGISLLDPDSFERLFGVVMLLVLVPVLRGNGRKAAAETRPTWPAWLRALVFFAIGLYGGALQAGVGLALILALSHSGFDLVRANSIKVVVVAALTLVAVPVFIVQNQVAWLPAAALVLGFGLGGRAGASLAVHGGERLIRPVLAVSVLALAGRMLSLY
jgi:uncharacterized membrane protein YfcA